MAIEVSLVLGATVAQNLSYEFSGIIMLNLPKALSSWLFVMFELPLFLPRASEVCTFF